MSLFSPGAYLAAPLLLAFVLVAVLFISCADRVRAHLAARRDDRAVRARLVRLATAQATADRLVSARRGFAPGMVMLDGDDERTPLERLVAASAERCTTLQAEIGQLDALDELSDEQNERFSAALTEFAEAQVEHTRLAERMAAVESVRSAAFDIPAGSANRERGAGGDQGNGGDGTRTRRTPEQERAARNAPYADLESLRYQSPKAWRDRAEQAVELSERMSDDAKETVINLLDGKGESPRHIIGKASRAAIAQHILTTGSDDYYDAFEAYMSDPGANAARAALSLAGANGGFTVPFTLDPTLIITNAGSTNPIRQRATIKTTATNTWNGITSAGVNAQWLGEAVEVADASPTVGQLQITPQKAAAWLFGSYELFEDSDMATEIPALLADARDRLEANAFAVGDGVGKPFGMVPRAITVASAAPGALSAADAYNVQAALPARFRRGGSSRPSWLANLSIIQRLRQFDTAGGSAFWANMGMGVPEELLGAPIDEATEMVGTITAGSKNLLLGDMSQYFIVDRIGMQVIYDPLVKGPNGRPTGQAGWFAFWRVGGDVSTSQAFRVLQEG